MEAPSSVVTGTKVGAHAFQPIGLRDMLHHHGRCAKCYRGRSAHPVKGWTEARPLGDKQHSQDYIEEARMMSDIDAGHPW